MAAFPARVQAETVSMHEASSMTIVHSTGANIDSGDGIGAGD
jgi:hypothetical protein